MRAQYGSRSVRILEPTVRECRECRGIGEVRDWDERGDVWAICSACQGSGETWR